MKNSPLREIVKQVMTHFDLEQSELAEVMDVPIDRVKSLSAGRVKKFAPSETQALVRKLGISANWLATGLGEMLQSEAEKRLNAKLGNAKDMAKSLEAREVTEDKRRFLTDVLYAYELGADDVLAELLSGITIANADEQKLLANWAQCSPESQIAIQRMVSELSNVNPKEKL